MRRPYRILVTGSREWSDPLSISRAMHTAIGQHGPVVLVHGGARGADELAHQVWRRWRVIDPSRYLPAEVHPAEWRRYGRSAGHRRNAEMVAAGADVCLAFPLGRSPGTRGCMAAVLRAGIPLINHGDPDPGADNATRKDTRNAR